jgi:hypothetical protein
MPVFFFDTRDGDNLDVDEVGLDFPDLDAARFEASRALTELARDVIPGTIRRELSIEVRDKQNLLLRTSIVFEVRELGV